ncbi:MAG: DUF3852 domain-containing protein [Clostridiales bacterium]|nr:DUF3852 domain-containing protein [Clostridiales bacterium]
MQFGIFAAALIFVFFAAATPVFAASGNSVYTAIYSTWESAQSTIKKTVNNVVFPVVDVILAVLFFVKLGTAYFDYKKHGQFEFAAPAILFACLMFCLIAPSYIWDIVGF